MGVADRDNPESVTSEKYRLPGIQEEPCPRSDAIDQQVQIPITIHIGQHSSRGQLIRAGGRADRLFLKMEIPPVAKQSIGALKRTQINVRSAIPIDIADGQPGAVVGHRIGQEGVSLEAIGEVQPSLPRIESREARSTGRPRLQNLGLNPVHRVGRKRHCLRPEREGAPDPDCSGENRGRPAARHRWNAE
jgi:hypothetical protein